jgi:hypothetical protein
VYHRPKMAVHHEWCPDVPVEIVGQLPMRHLFLASNVLELVNYASTIGAARRLIVNMG